MQPWYRFLLVGLLVAGLEEFITQGVLKDDLGSWLVPTIIAFTPFLMVVFAVDRLLYRRLGESGAAVVGYVVAGTIGLLFEWFVTGLSPWRDPNVLQIPFQVGMFSFWGTVAFAPRLLLDRRDRLSRIRKAYIRFLVLSFTLIYGLAFTASRGARSGFVLAAVLLTFILLNGFHAVYLRALRQLEKHTEITPCPPARWRDRIGTHRSRPGLSGASGARRSQSGA